ncbi:hypothetical protein BpHYR1_000289 [Brachionus plicatilis]|uniref:Uncharacterized protein n=1 Tax=Brachionus plicatilis TaxID=10195 RepID=A0A3M7P3S5_BRAPC|nr:hypothetical protein BpHYR1_000289 [Brachionus plicatilis]
MATGSLSIFEKHTKLDMTEEQVKRLKGGLRFRSENIEKLVIDSGIIDSKYTVEMFNTDLKKVIRKFSASGKYPKGSKFVDKVGFEVLIHQIAETKRSNYETILEKLNSAPDPIAVAKPIQKNNSNNSKGLN